VAEEIKEGVAVFDEDWPERLRCGGKLEAPGVNGIVTPAVTEQNGWETRGARWRPEQGLEV